MPQMVQGLVGQSGGLSSVPSRFVQPAHGSPRRTHSSDQLDAVPVIDMEGMHAPDQELRSRVVAEIAKACEEWGFFQVSEVTETRKSSPIHACLRSPNVSGNGRPKISPLCNPCKDLEPDTGRTNAEPVLEEK
ncbi:uncharacterized protein [Physcomitrium patens]|uniref:uncharacterized protein isoform X4 n=1 Tax=Physcomitrium patens TaxID=3218 RepID=UPI003CCD09EC